MPVVPTRHTVLVLNWCIILYCTNTWHVLLSHVVPCTDIIMGWYRHIGIGSGIEIVNLDVGHLDLG